MIYKEPHKHANKGFALSLILLLFSVLAVLTKIPSMILLGGILSALAIVLTVFFYTKGDWEYIGWEDPLFPDD